jgi:multisubunit Na+/H+ antiporter MnhF subunit
METVLNVVLYTSLAIHIVMMDVAIWRVWRGESAIDRLIGVDLLGTLTAAVLILVALISQRSIFISVAIGLAVLSFVGTIALAKYLTDKKMF